MGIGRGAAVPLVSQLVWDKDLVIPSGYKLDGDMSDGMRAQVIQAVMDTEGIPLAMKQMYFTLAASATALKDADVTPTSYIVSTDMTYAKTVTTVPGSLVGTGVLRVSWTVQANWITGTKQTVLGTYVDGVFTPVGVVKTLADNADPQSFSDDINVTRGGVIAVGVLHSTAGKGIRVTSVQPFGTMTIAHPPATITWS